ncbi:MAG: transglycosylase domain-containing protein [Actinomycetota bacterium]
MAVPQHHRTRPSRPHGPRRWGEATFAAPLRPVLLAGTIMITALALAATLLPPVLAVGKAAQNLTGQLGCQQKSDLVLKLPRVAQRSTILASDGSIMARLYLENRKVVRLDKIAPIAKKAVLGIEDYQFYQHGGVDVKAIFRALVANLKAGHVTQGGSTISQQLVKVITNQRADTIGRKVCEAEQAMQLERKYSKDTILEMYLNEIYLGHGAYGMEAAAETYFRAHSWSLTLPQAAMLAGMIANPSQYDPVANPDAVLNRRNTVLGRMAEVHFITPAQAHAAEATPLRLAKSSSQQRQPQQPLFVQFVRHMIEENTDGQFDVLGRTRAARDRAMFQGGLTIDTTFDPAWQQFAVDTIHRHLALKSDPEAAIATVEPGTGAVRVLASGRNFDKSRTDLVWQAQHQEGSAFKPFTLVAAFREGIPAQQVYPSYSPATDLADRCNGWAPVNAEGGGDLGFMDLYKATALSINAVFGRLAADVGPQNIGKAAEDMGIHLSHPVGPEDCSVTLGTFETSPLDMATGYATLAAGGKYCPYYGVEKILGPGPKHKLIYRHDPSKTCHQVIRRDIAYQVTDMLKGVLAYGTGAARAPIGRPAAGKTGTTENFENAWFCGYTPQLASAVWVGYPGKPKPMLGIEGFSEMFGGDIPALMWHDVMLKFTSRLPPNDFPAPPPPATGQVPSVVGKSQSEALKILAKANFSGTIGSAVYSTLPVGNIASQSPGGGSTVILGSLISLHPSNGQPPTKSVPGVVGLSKAAAAAALHAAGFGVAVNVVDTSDQKQDGIVIAQSPHGGSHQLIGATVTISVGKFVKPPPPSPPSPSPKPSHSPKPKPTHSPSSH